MHIAEFKIASSSRDTDEDVTLRRNGPSVEDWRPDLYLLEIEYLGASTFYHKLQRKTRKVKTPIFISKICILNSKCVPGSVGNKVQNKLEQVLQRNVGLKDLRTASDILAGKNTDLQCNIPVQLVSKLKYAPVTSVDVERSFSA
ncbi:hypothetical protein ANN_25882 [Periplaneta americana]|uniref:Uncharacterized protein n=1 Tax=Periplaneta americana TaxID=6978 RepID=A0ABQ8S4D6_PERAM|nr:hypothetical protein ANN_25882 [Periplaneta americana]